MLPPFSLIRWYASVSCVIDRSDRNPPFTATSLTFRPSLRRASGLRLVDFDPICRNIYHWGKFWKRFHGYFVFESRVSAKTVVSNCAKTFSMCKIVYSNTHIPRYDDIHVTIQNITTEQPTWNRQEQWPLNATHVRNQRIAKSFRFQPLTDVLTRKSNAPPGGPHFGSNSPLYRA